MSELALVAESKNTLNAEANTETHFNESRARELQPTNERGNTRILDYINNGLFPDQMDRRLEVDLQAPEVQRRLLNEFSPYSDQITPYIRTTQELSVYTQNGLRESSIFDRPCLQSEINLEATDAMGRTNVERMAAGRAPIDENGDPVNLHHIGQREESPLAELPDRVHKQYDAVLHDKTIPTEVHGLGNNWNEERSQYWRERVKTL
jgi:hypothetical protein